MEHLQDEKPSIEIQNLRHLQSLLSAPPNTTTLLHIEDARHVHQVKLLVYSVAARDTPPSFASGA
ncbi:MAG: hypothetical protein P8M62_05930 [Opitutae bacterium]|nr:hypothetical protein [Opitutae bacterium]